VRIFLDTNVLASAVGSRGLCADLLRYVLAEHDLVIGQSVLDELRRVLQEKFRLPRDRVDEVEELLRSHEIVPRPESPERVRVRDPDDAWILANARAAGADVLITGDGDLLAVAASLPFRILTPRAFWEEIRRGAR
jgi:putative PIN family toxin of toxin-antitoxin system